MSNRTMAAKAVKLRRQKRAWAKAYNVRSYKQPNRLVINEYKQRAQGLAFGEVSIDAIANEFLPGKLEMRAKEYVRNQALLELMMPVDCDLRFTGPTIPDIYQESFIYFNAKKTKFVLVLRDLEQHTERVSYVFSSKELLIMTWEMDRVNWVGRRPLV